MTATAPDRPYATWDPSQATDDPDGLPDRAIVPLIESLRARGIVTLQSCTGHLEDQPDGSRGGRDGTLWVRADSVDGAHIRLFLTGEPFDRVQYAYLPDGPHWEFGWHPDRAEEAMRALGGLLPAVPAEQPAPGQALRWAADNWSCSGNPVRERADLRRWAEKLDAAPTTYTMPAEPPETVTELWDRHGCRWQRDVPGHWLLVEQADAGEGRVWHPMIPCVTHWRSLLAEHGDLSTVPPEATEAGDG